MYYYPMKKINKKILIKTLLIIIFLVLVGIVGINSRKNVNTTDNSSQLETNNPTPQAKFKDFHLEITKLNISAPVIANVDGKNKEIYDSALENGVAQFAGTANPGEKSNIFIFGHSSYYLWDPGEYKTIFAKLNDLDDDDLISVWWQQKEYIYKVTDKKIVSPNDVSVLKPTESEQLTLMTCWPIGTIDKRLIVIAKPN
ncbi:TPA: hypothetical protein DD449_04775 [Candidatus Berkelbacteria bacterium]|uniref:Putative sortase n=1 Tax=Berkelbacteria bacterium GW2011_GWE1_39_12 TaxID=1618337 RepID=A0A0G4B3F9_9BACT|nr:MAG: putative sortase [Berkelbacteria bacterium GW2011_GWE1_39_12]HBO60969.1 hypothetical protein [Candidatus Berkelbacteria bacterium]